MNSRFDWTILEAINNAFRAVKAAPLVLGGVVGSGGGGGGPVGGFVGHLPQTRVTYDLSELATPSTPASGMSLLDNLNHIRQRLTVVEASSGGGGSPLSVEDEGVLVSSGVTVLNFEGDSVTATETSTGIVTISISGITGSGGGLYTESETPPSSGTTGDRWLDTSAGILFTYVSDIDSSQWVELSPGGVGATSSGVTGSGGHIILDNGSPMDQRTYLDFVGSGVIVTDDSGNDKTVITISGGGGGGGYTSRVRATTDSGQALGTSATLIKYNTEVYDTLNEHNTSDGKFTAKATGYYHVSWSILTDYTIFSANHVVASSLYKNDSEYSTGLRVTIQYAITGYIQTIGSDDIYLEAGEYITIKGYSNVATTLYASHSFNYLSIHRFG